MPITIVTIPGVFTHQRYTDLLRAYNKAVQAHLVEFEFESRFLLTAFAQDVVERLAETFDPQIDYSKMFEKLKQSI
jgi:hypothetical protein